MNQNQPQVDYSQILFQDIERELNKLRTSVQQMETNQKQTKSKIEQLDVAVNGQQGGSIIQPTKLKSILNQNEKKRYTEIGKRFLQGAENQFMRVKRKIRFKEGMKTSKDTFLSGIEKIKQQKIHKEKVSFWTKLLGGLVIISVAAFIFKDKVMKMMPNLTQQSGGLVERVFKWVGTLIKGCYDFITQAIGGSVISVFNKLVTQSIPKILQIFFLETLPQAIFNTHLAVLSVFSQAAGDRLDQQIGHDPLVRQDIEDTVDENASQAQEALNNGEIVYDSQGHAVRNPQPQRQSQGLYNSPQLEELEQIKQKINQGKQLSQQEIMKYRRGMGNLAIHDDSQKYKQIQVMLGQLVELSKQNLQLAKGEGKAAKELTEGDWQQHFIQIIGKGQFDTNSFMQYYKKHIAQARIGTEEQQKAAQIEVLARATAEAQGIVNEEKIQQMIKNLTNFYSDKELNQLDDFGNFIRDLYKEEQQLNKAVERQQQEIKERAQRVKPPLVSLQLHTITDVIIQPILQFVKAVDEFLKGGINVSKISDTIKKGFQQLAQYFNGFFKNTVGFLVNFIHNIQGITVTVPGMKDQKAEANAKKQGKELPKAQTILGRTQAKEGSVAFIADFGTLAVAPLAEFVEALSTKEAQIVKVIEETTTHVHNLEKTVQTLKDLNKHERDYLGAVASQLGVVDKGLLTHIQTNKRVIATTKSEVNRIGKLLEQMKNTPYRKDTYLLAQVDDL